MTKWRVTWQLLSKFLYVRVTRWSQNALWDPEENRKLSFRSYIIIYRLFNLAKTNTEICHTYGRFLFAFPIKLHTSIQNSISEQSFINCASNTIPYP